jgi:hypothetical protein
MLQAGGLISAVAPYEEIVDNRFAETARLAQAAG